MGWCKDKGVAEGNLGRKERTVLDPDCGDGHTFPCIGENLKTVYKKKKRVNSTV